MEGSKMIGVDYISMKRNTPARGYWDQALIDDILKSLDHFESDRTVCVIPGAYQTDYYKEINFWLRTHEKVLVIITSDEESKFDTTKLRHPDMIIYSTYALKDKNTNVDLWLPLGYTPHTRPTLEQLGRSTKENKWFFSGQITHESRRQLAKELRELENGTLVETAGFTQGLPREEYIKAINDAKVVPSPAGAVCPDAFRTYETLEAGSIPIPENRAYYEMVLNNPPFVILEEWTEVANYINDYADRFPQLHNEVFAWWQLEKRNIKQRLMTDLGIQDDITVIVPTSPIPSHPSTEILDETIANIRKQLPHSEIIITFDGIRKEQKKYTEPYQEYISKVLWKCNFEWDNVTPVIFKEHKHQIGMAREVLKLVNTPTILYVEHDTPITPDEFIDWDSLVNAIKSKKANMIRFHFETAVHPEHKYLMLDETPEYVEGAPLLRTAQWSQRPHLASTEFYRQLVDKYFSPKAKSMIEDKMHGVLVSAYQDKGRAGWNDFKVWLYAPKGNIKRSYHTDGRQNDKKYDNKQIF